MAVSKRDVLIGATATAFSTASDAAIAATRGGPRVYTLANGDAVMSLLEGAPYVSFGSGNAILYEVSFRACGPCISFARGGSRDVVRAGFQLRTFVFSPKSSGRGGSNGSAGEMASVAEIYRTRNADYYDAWFRSNNIDGFASNRGVPDITSNAIASAAVADGRAKIKELAALLEQSPVGPRWGFPVFIWRGREGVKATFGYGGARPLLRVVRQG